MRDFAQYLKKNWMTYIVSIVVLVITFLVTVMSVLMYSSVNNTIKNMEEKVQIVGYVSNDISAFKLDKVKQELYKIENIKEVEYKENSLELDNFIESLSVGNEKFLDVLNDNPLDDSLSIKLKDTTKIEDTYSKILELEDFTENNLLYNSDGVDIIKNLNVMFYVVLITLLIVIALITVPIINIIIKNSIDNRSNEIRVKRLVGAKKVSILKPIILELLVMFVIASTIYGILSYVLLKYIRKIVEGLHISTLEIGSLREIFIMSAGINALFGAIILIGVLTYVSRRKIKV